MAGKYYLGNYSNFVVTTGSSEYTALANTIVHVEDYTFRKTVKLPTSPSAGDSVIFVDSKDEFSRHMVKVDGNSKKVCGFSYVFMNSPGTFVFTYNSTNGWTCNRQLLKDPCISCGPGTTHAIDRFGRVWSWGRNNSGQLGDNSLTSRSSAVTLYTTHSFVKLGRACYTDMEYTMAALKEDGTVWMWGDNTYGTLGDNTGNNSKSSPVSVSGTSFIEIAIGGSFTLGLKADGSVWAWGYNNYGELGNNTRNSQLVPVSVLSVSSIVQISAGYRHSMALRADGIIFAWGYNADGQLGDGTTISRSVAVSAICITPFAKIACGQYHNIALGTNGILYTWGWNSDCGVLGQGIAANFSSPLWLNAVSDRSFVDIFTCYRTNYALEWDGHLWAWGLNSVYQTGCDYFTSATFPLLAGNCSSQGGASSMEAYYLAGGYEHTFSLGPEGDLWYWGLGQYGKFGDNWSPYTNAYRDNRRLTFDKRKFVV